MGGSLQLSVSRGSVCWDDGGAELVGVEVGRGGTWPLMKTRGTERAPVISPIISCTQFMPFHSAILAGEIGVACDAEKGMSLHDEMPSQHTPCLS